MGIFKAQRHKIAWCFQRIVNSLIWSEQTGCGEAGKETRERGGVQIWGTFQVNPKRVHSIQKDLGSLQRISSRGTCLPANPTQVIAGQDRFTWKLLSGAKSASQGKEFQTRPNTGNWDHKKPGNQTEPVSAIRLGIYWDCHNKLLQNVCLMQQKCIVYGSGGWTGFWQSLGWWLHGPDRCLHFTRCSPHLHVCLQISPFHKDSSHMD